MSSTGKKTEAYVDTSALIAFADGSDTYHPLFRRLFANPPRLVTAATVLAEGHAWFLKRYDRTRALHFIAMVEAMPIRVLSVGVTEHNAAVAVLRRFSDQDLTLVDAIGLHYLAKRNIEVCWSTDFHLGLTGVTLAIHM